jgi:hypothetical protein
MDCACAVLSSVACPALLYFSISHKRHDKKKLLYIKCVSRFSLQFWSETFLILRISERDMITNVYCSSCKVPVILVWFYRNLIFLGRFSKRSSRIYRWKKFASRPIGRPKNRWEDDVKNDLQTMQIKNLKKSLLNRDWWKIIVERTKTHRVVSSIKKKAY